MDVVPDSLTVRLNGYPVGTLARLPGNTITFFFTQQYLDDPDRPTLSWGLLDAFRRPRTRPYSASLGIVPPFFANLLPEGDLRRYVAHRAGVSVQDDFALLWVTGADLPGAVTLRDPHGRPLPPPSAGGPARDVPESEVLRFSLAGVQLKFSALENARGGLTISVQGTDGDWIVKLPSRHLERVPENEFAMLRYAEAVGIAIPEIRLVDVEQIRGLPDEALGLAGPALAVRRFDRGAGGTRIHIEDFNQIFRQVPKMKYDNRSFADIAATVYQAAGIEALVDFIHRLVFSVGIANNDMHLKNWSFVYRDGRTPTLAPAYDYVCTKAYLGHNETGLAIGSARYFEAVTIEQFDLLAQRAGISRGSVVNAAQEMVDRMRSAWPTIRDGLPFNGIRATIEAQFERVPLFNPKNPPVGPAISTGEDHEEVS